MIASASVSWNWLWMELSQIASTADGTASTSTLPSGSSFGRSHSSRAVSRTSTGRHWNSSATAIVTNGASRSGTARASRQAALATMFRWPPTGISSA